MMTLTLMVTGTGLKTMTFSLCASILTVPAFPYHKGAGSTMNGWSAGSGGFIVLEECRAKPLYRGVNAVWEVVRYVDFTEVKTLSVPPL